MSDKYVIVIEVDYLEARRCYQKGMDDLNLAWPEFYSVLSERDKAAEIFNKTEELKEQQARDAYCLNREKENKYRDEYFEWEKQSKWCRGPEPVKPKMERTSYPYYHRTRRDYLLPTLESIKVSLQEKINLVNLAQSNFRMTEYDVKEMISWGDGSKVDQLKKYYIHGPQFIWDIRQ